MNSTESDMSAIDVYHPCWIAKFIMPTAVLLVSLGPVGLLNTPARRKHQKEVHQDHESKWKPTNYVHDADPKVE